MNDLFAEEMNSGSTCEQGHPIKLIAEGYGYCYAPDWDNTHLWRFSPPRTDDGLEQWGVYWTQHDLENGKEAWVTSNEVANGLCPSEAVRAALADMEAHRALPFDEEAERARLMPV